MKRGIKRFLCLFLVLCMMSGCASPADKGAKETVTPTSKPIEEITPTVEPADEVTPAPTVEPTAAPTEEPAEPTPTPVTAVFVPEKPAGDAVVLADKTINQALGGVKVKGLGGDKKARKRGTQSWEQFLRENPERVK